MKLDEKYLNLSKVAIICHKEVDERVGSDLKHKNLPAYIKELSKAQEDKGLTNHVILLIGIHENRKEEVENVLKKLSFKYTTHVEVYFRNGEQLAAVYEVKKK